MVTQESKKSLEELLMASLSEDSAAYRLFLHEISRYLRRFIGRRVPASDIDDVLQDILLSLHKARATYDGKRSVLPWVSAIARFRITDYLRTHYASMGHLKADIDDVEDSLSADVTEPTGMSECIAEEVAKLPERQQRILYLMHTQGYTAKEVAKQVGMNESAVKVAAHRAYKLIKTRLTG